MSSTVDLRILSLILISSVRDKPLVFAQSGQSGQSGQSAYLPETNNYVFSQYNNKVYSLPSMVVPVPCQAYVLREQLNYICAHGKIWCLPGWKNPKNYCRDPDCPEGCDLDHGECNEPNVCSCKVGYYGHACQNCITLPGCFQGTCSRAFECTCREGWTGIYCNKAVCKVGCHPEAGFCDLPNECRSSNN